LQDLEQYYKNCYIIIWSKTLFSLYLCF